MNMKKNKCLAIIVLLIITMFMGTNKAYAKYSTQCYYFDQEGASGKEAKLTLTITAGYGSTILHNMVGAYTNINVDFFDGAKDDDSEHISNWFYTILAFTKFRNAAGTEMPEIFNNAREANAIPYNELKNHCPNFIVIQKCTLYREFGIKSEDDAKRYVAEINAVEGCVAHYVSKGKIGKDGEITENYTASEYYKGLLGKEASKKIGGETACTKTQIFGDPKDSGKGCKNLAEGGECTESYPSPAYMINQVLTYFRIIVPALLVLFGTIDFAKATISGEDEMKKAQKKFFTRLGIAVAVFFVPTVVNIIMRLCDEMIGLIQTGKCK